MAGHLSRADVVLRGPIRHFPFRDGSGLFLARCALEGMTLDYGEGWPRVENLAAQAEFRNEGMSAHFLSGRVGDMPVGSADARFADFKTGELEIHVGAGGDAADALAFLRATPLDASAETRVFGRGGQGLDANPRGFVSAVQGFRAPARAGAWPLGRGDAQPVGIDRDGHAI